MRKLVMKMSVSLDGFVSPANEDNQWIFKNSDEESKAWSVEKSKDSGLIIMGRKSFGMMAPFWPTASGPFAAPMNEIPKAVFTQKGYKTLPAVSDSPAAKSWAEARVFDGDLAENIKKLKQEPGKNISAIGGAGFMRSLIATGLIDIYHIAIHPVAFGSGFPIFSDLEKPLDLKLVATKAFPGGIVAHTYHCS